MNNNNYFMETTTCPANPVLSSCKDYDVQQQKELERLYDVQRQAVFQQQLAVQQSMYLSSNLLIIYYILTFFDY
jgi:hypothetical protein